MVSLQIEIMQLFLWIKYGPKFLILSIEGWGLFYLPLIKVLWQFITWNAMETILC